MSPLANSVYQGTVLGPPLWNEHFGDASAAACVRDSRDTVYADDLNAFKSYARDVSFDDIIAGLAICQQDLHKLGAGNCVSFDAAKESFHVIHRRWHYRSQFKILGINFDNHLRMLPFIESGSLSFLHAPKSTMAPSQRIQDRLLRAINASLEDGLMVFNLAPLQCRRDIAALAILRKFVLGLLPNSIARVFAYADSSSKGITRLQQSRHNRQIMDAVRGREPECYKSSLF